MALFESDQKKTVNGYVQNESKPIRSEYFPVERVIRMKIFRHKGKIYFKTRDVSFLLGMKQPFDFVANCKAYFGQNCILKGPQTKPFRDKSDSDRVTFIEAGDLLQYLLNEQTKYSQTFLPGMYEKVTEGLKQMLNEFDSVA